MKTFKQAIKIITSHSSFLYCLFLMAWSVFSYTHSMGPVFLEGFTFGGALTFMVLAPVSDEFKRLARLAIDGDKESTKMCRELIDAGNTVLTENKRLCAEISFLKSSKDQAEA